MVACHVAALFLVVLEERELCHPEEVEGVLGNEVQLLGDVHAQVAEGRVDHLGLAGLEEDEVADLEAETGADGLLLLVGEELGNGGLPFRFGLDLDPGKALGAVDAHELGIGVYVLARKALAALDLDGLDHGRLGKELEA